MNIITLFLSVLLSIPGTNTMDTFSLQENVIIKEVASLRTESSKTFELSNGNFETRLYDHNIHYFDSSSQAFKECNNKFVINEQSAYLNYGDYSINANYQLLLFPSITSTN